MKPYDPAVILDAPQESFADAVAAVVAARRANFALIQAFSRAWYHAPYTYGSVRVFGTTCLKTPTDLWLYQELIGRLRPGTIVETGTAFGGSALWFALCCDGWGLPADVRVVTVDPVARPNRPTHPRLVYVEGDSADPAVLPELLATAPSPWLISLDSDHRASHVARELALIEPLTLPGDYVVVEDTCVDRLAPDEPGPYAAVADFLAQLPAWQQDGWCERFWLTFSPGGWLFKT